MCTEIDKHCEIGHKRLLMSSIETENQLSYCGSTITHCILALRERARVIFLNNEAIFTDIDLKFDVNKNSDSLTLKLY